MDLSKVSKKQFPELAVWIDTFTFVNNQLSNNS